MTYSKAIPLDTKLTLSQTDYKFSVPAARSAHLLDDFQMTNFFLSHEELIALTGYRKKSLQLKQLCRQKIPFSMNALGEPVVIRDSIERFITGLGPRSKKEPQLNLTLNNREKKNG